VGFLMIGSFEQHVALLKQLTKLNDLQKLLIELYDKPDKTPAETKNLAALVVSEKAAIRANNAKQKAQNLINTEKSKAKVLARKKRTRKLIELGALFEMLNFSELCLLLLQSLIPQNWRNIKKTAYCS
jgi:hypothetical protein